MLILVGVWAILGAIIVALRPANAVGWLFMAAGLWLAFGLWPRRASTAWDRARC